MKGRQEARQQKPKFFSPVCAHLSWRMSTGRSYRSLGRSYSRIGVMAANNLSAYAIEEALMSTRNDIYVIGTGNMAIVRAIEDGLSPAEVVETCGLADMVKYMESCGAEAIVLGCTHFPYIREELAKLTDLPLIDPADKMYEALTDK